MRSLGVSADQVAAGRAHTPLARPAAGPALWRWFARPFEVFAAMRRQWRTASRMDAVHFVGLDYGVLALCEQRLGLVPLNREEFALLRRLESLGAEVLNRG